MAVQWLANGMAESENPSARAGLRISIEDFVSDTKDIELNEASM